MEEGRGKTQNVSKSSELLKSKSCMAYLQSLGTIFFNYVTAYEHHSFHQKILHWLVKGYIL
jgi:hypothetical protein